MATNKFSSIVLLSLMVFAAILLPMISGQMIPCLEGVCTNSSECNEPCKSKGYQGGACVRMSIDTPTGACCCKPNFKSQDSFEFNDINN
ncbi:unnamed protein product [Arabidopsis lyrata]|uniref:Uncharacterized protein n=1 Tax=Arabidopsis lyrata subsp. lyrata TaxID=81972 RepID=D7MMP7_ARALL|nr:putative defensin-like protein 83 [Arabidopsis lyrata subsp. lyrata]EFH40190.1 hypothetical protein ARALYDRAFT_331300 [Arabidopsis lyrata subsp. lyrata]CAH8278940.1 unnamed protein product [Arabidopsis lyrata]|eukprot:XP_002863931.1 putative defensin-like protein 83 [Arabidopsis lyrata subsp. lyrata]